jgi:predicted outer membrane repeat protein
MASLTWTTKMIRSFGAFVLVVGILAVHAPGVSAAASSCKVRNFTTKQLYLGSGQNLQSAMDAAASGTRLNVSGVCRGNFIVSKVLKLFGLPTTAYPTPTLDGNAAGTVLTVRGPLQLKDLTITNGYTTGVPGAGIANFAFLTLRGTTSVRGNTAVNGNGGGIYDVSGSVTLNGSSSVSGNAARQGGGIYLDGAGIGVILRGSSSVSGNTASEGGGIYGYSVEMYDSARVNNNSATGDGGGIHGTATLRGPATSVSGNTATGNGGGIVGSAFIEGNSRVNNNSAMGDGGGVYGYVTLYNSTHVNNNKAAGDGGGIYGGGDVGSFTQVNGNSATRGGGIFDYQHILNLYESAQVSGNTATGDGGGVWNHGGGIEMYAQVSDNTAQGNGGGIYNDLDGTVQLRLSASVTGNTATSGGGIYNVTGALVEACTVHYLWTGAISPNAPDDPPALTPSAC